MIDSPGRAATVASATVRKSVEFLSIELSLLADGQLFVSIMATAVDDEEPQLLSQEIASERVSTVQDALTLIADRVSTIIKKESSLGQG
jgi:hypothetical protein